MCCWHCWKVGLQPQNNPVSSQPQPRPGKVRTQFLLQTSGDRAHNLVDGGESICIVRLDQMRIHGTLPQCKLTFWRFRVSLSLVSKCSGARWPAVQTLMQRRRSHHGHSARCRVPGNDRPAPLACFNAGFRLEALVEYICSLAYRFAFVHGSVFSRVVYLLVSSEAQWERALNHALSPGTTEKTRRAPLILLSDPAVGALGGPTGGC